MLRKQRVVLLCGCLLGLAVGRPASAQLVDIFSNSNDLSGSIGSVIGCDLSARLKADMDVEPLYANSDGSCLVQVPRNTGEYFTDSQCLNSVQFTRTGQQQFCSGVLDKQQLGNGASVTDGWTLSPGARYDIGVKGLDGLMQPYRTSTSYRTISTVRGECQLEMRVYKNSIASDDQYPLIAFHGGSWKARGFGTMGIESVAAHYTNKGFVVFAPYYRLLSESEPNVECQSATITQIVDDAEFALQWVNQNAGFYGASGKPVVMGQSAGAHLALALAVNKSNQVASAVLMYPPTDFSAFVNLVVAGQYANEEGLRVLQGVLGTDAAQADLSLAPIPENSFPARVASDPERYPPMIMFHGLADELVPASQSVRLCNALAGRALDTGYDETGELQQTLQCGADSLLHLIKQGNHALDICLTSSDVLDAGCPAGGQDSRQVVAELLDQTTDFVQSVAREDRNTASGQGGGAPGYISIAVLGVLLFWRRRLCFVDV